ncbi:hypothetical protein F5144DRAFT_605594 [Chaetomium tenue]|uniref:Uncharacterized protein n=1 Tax=Chaetomium tenue TaxID=1854479 RepID=A0ACB7P0I3_9PEZI|nr:hypothetical protein F5144DRAFT_605594 [Chaetomium globosum]
MADNPMDQDYTIPTALPATAYLFDPDSDLTENLHWYGPGKLHPTHLGDTFAQGRYAIIHKLDHSPHTLSWLARDLNTNTWRRLDTVHAATALARPRFRAAAADALGLALAICGHEGPNGSHVCIVWPLDSRKHAFRAGVPWGGDEIPMNADWFMNECAKLRGGVPPLCLHDIGEQEMLAILGRPRLIMADAEMRRRALVSQDLEWDQVPCYLVLRPDRIVDSGSSTEAEVGSDSEGWSERIGQALGLE